MAAHAPNTNNWNEVNPTHFWESACKIRWAEFKLQRVFLSRPRVHTHLRCTPLSMCVHIYTHKHTRKLSRVIFKFFYKIYSRNEVRRCICWQSRWWGNSFGLGSGVRGVWGLLSDQCLPSPSTVKWFTSPIQVAWIPLKEIRLGC